MDSIPKDWIKAVNDWDNNEIALRGYILYHLNEIKIDGLEKEFSQKENIKDINKNIKKDQPKIEEKEMECQKFVKEKTINSKPSKKKRAMCCYIF